MVSIPFNEHYRLQALSSYNVLDTPPDSDLDRITRLAAVHFDVPIALISLVAPLRQWFKSRFGLEATETSREASFCGHAILGDEILQVPDATRDPRFADNPLVTGAPWIRFYAGAPLVTSEGFRLGSLCLIDRHARRPLNEDGEATLRDLAALVVNALDHKRMHGQGLDPQAQTQEAEPHLRDPHVRELELARDAQLDLIASLSHELRTPLNAILGFSDSIHKQLFGPIQNHKYLEYSNYIFESGNHLLGILNNVLDFAKMRNGDLGLNEEPVDVVKAQQCCADMFVEQARQAGISITCDLSGDLPALWADRRQLTQMLVNLIGNGLKYTREGGWVRVSGRLDGDGSMIVEVADSGIGIAPRDIERALVAFGRIDNELTRKHNGTGLGLPLTKRLIELHGGRLTIGSGEGRGTAACLHFPPYRVGPEPPQSEDGSASIEATSSRVA